MNLVQRVLRRLAPAPPAPAPRRPRTEHRLELPSFALVEPDPADRPLARRIMDAYVRMKADQPTAPSQCLPSSLWQEHLDTAYAELASGDLDRFHRFLANFGSWPQDTGIEANAGQLQRDPKARQEFLDTIERALVWWQKTERGDGSLAELSYPRHGNQVGALVDGVFLGRGSAGNLYLARELNRLLPAGRPLIGELGTGFGKLAHFLLRDRREFAYLCFDLPEVLCCCMYYLGKCFPDRRLLFYGEEPFGPASLDRHDLCCLPAWEMAKLEDRQLDLFINKNSLGEMLPETCRWYVGQISRVTRAFYHMNHEFTRNPFSDGSASLLAGEYPVDPARLHLYSRHLDFYHLLASDRLQLTSDIFCYIYLERPPVAGGLA